MSQYDTRKKLAELAVRFRAIPDQMEVRKPVGDPRNPDNAGDLTGMGQLSEIYDVLDDDGNALFSLGTTGMTDTVVVE